LDPESSTAIKHGQRTVLTLKLSGPNAAQHSCHQLQLKYDDANPEIKQQQPPSDAANKCCQLLDPQVNDTSASDDAKIGC